MTALGVLTTVLGGGEPELAVRGGSAYLRLLARPSAGAGPGDPAGPADEVSAGCTARHRAARRTAGHGTAGHGRPAPPGTVLVTGGTGTLGGLVARHLARDQAGPPPAPGLQVRAGRAPASRRWPPGWPPPGPTRRVTACDAADRPALAAALAAIPAAAPLTGVIHAAGVPGGSGVPDDRGTGRHWGLPATPARIDAVMRPKADAAWHLHQLTAGTALEMFVLFSGAAGALGAARAVGLRGWRRVPRRAGQLPACRGQPGRRHWPGDRGPAAREWRPTATSRRAAGT